MLFRNCIYKKIDYKTDFMFTSIFGISNKRRTISIFCFSTATPSVVLFKNKKFKTSLKKKNLKQHLKSFQNTIKSYYEIPKP